MLWQALFTALLGCVLHGFTQQEQSQAPPQGDQL